MKKKRDWLLAMDKEPFTKLSKNGIRGRQPYTDTNKAAVKIIIKYVGGADSNYLDRKWYKLYKISKGVKWLKDNTLWLSKLKKIR